MWLIFGIWDGSSIQKSFFMIKSLTVFRQNSSESATVLSIHIVCIPTCTYQRWVSYFGALVPICFGYRATIQPSNAMQYFLLCPYKHAWFRQLRRPLYLREGHSTMWNTGQKGQVFAGQQYDELVQISKKFLIFGCLISKNTLSTYIYDCRYVLTNGSLQRSDNPKEKTILSTFANPMIF